jgi:type IV secretory pathway VirB4 component
MKNEMHSNQLTGAKPAMSTQSHLDVAEIKEGTVVLKDGGLRAVIVVSSTNFSLKSLEEQNALVNSYQSFLNSLDFPIEILMQSRKLDIHSYLDKLRSIMQTQTNELLRMQTQEYIEYVGKLIEFASIMNKTFYVVVPYSGVTANEGFMKRLSQLLNPVSGISAKEQGFEQHRELLYQRVLHITASLGSMGLRSLVLSTEELIELLYNSYNLNTSSPLKIKSVADLEMVNPSK